MINGNPYLRVNVANTSADGTVKTGSPELALRCCPIQLLGIKGNSVEVMTSEYDDVANSSLVPRPHLKKGDVDPLLVYSADPKAYAGVGYVPSELVRLEHVGETRGVFLGNLAITPYAFNPALRIVRKYKRIVVAVHYGETMGTSINTDDLTQGIAINQFARSKSPRPRSIRTTPVTSSVLAAGSWFRFTVADEGMYKLTGQALLSAGIPSTADPNTIQIFGNGGYEVPMDVSLPYPDDLRENAIYVVDSGTPGHLDASDYIIFFGKGTRGWAYNPSDKTYYHYLNHYTELNEYWLTYGQTSHKPMASLPSTIDPGAYQLTSLDKKAFHEDDKVNIASSGLEWLGPPMNAGDQVVYVTPLAGVDVSQPIAYRFHVGASSSDASYVSLYEHGTQLGGAIYLQGTTIGDDLSRQLYDATVNYSLLPSFSDHQSQIRISYSTTGAGGNGYLDWFELFYKVLPAAQNDLAVFSTPDTSSNVRCAIGGFSAPQPFVFDVTSYDSVLINVNPQRIGDSCVFEIQGTPGQRREIYVVGSSQYKTPGALSVVANENLRGDTTFADEIIFSNSDMMSAALRLKTFREQNALNPLKVKVVDVNQVYDEFSGGLLSPQAIRNYLRYATANWSTPPRYALLFGTGAFDYRNIVGSHIEDIPPWETDESFFPIFSYATDDAFAILNPDGRVDLGIGRLTPHTLQEANAIVDKIIEYETHPQEDAWRIRTTFVADDALQAPGVNDGTIHLDHAEHVASIIPSLFEQKKIYEFSYPTVITASGRRKPEVNTAIVNQINDGTLLLNFSGHGNPDLWTHEHIFVRETDFPLLANKGKYFFLIAATCNFSQFDGIDKPSGGELLVTMANAGAIGGFSATRSVVEPSNEATNIAFVQQLFRTDASGRVLPERLGDVVFRAKQFLSGDLTNDRKYYLLGDPGVLVGFPTMFASIDSINHVPGTQVSRLQALQRTSLNVTVRDTLMQPLTSFSGLAQIIVYDADQTVQINDPDAGIVTWKTEGGALFRGRGNLENGTTIAQFIVPKDISYGNDFGRVTTYFSNSSTDGAGYTTNITFGGIDSTAPVDTRGPDIKLFIDNRGFRPGDMVSASPTLIADLSDSSGINTTGAGVGHRLEMWLDDNAQSVDLSSFYQTDPNTFTRGSLEYHLGGLSRGSHQLRLRGWDTYDNPTTVQTLFEVMAGAGLQLNNVYNFPNPFRSSTFFTFQHNQVVPIDAEVKIFTVAGRLIQDLKMQNIISQFVQIPWDGKDREGDMIANGVYLYKIIASTQDRRFTTEAVGKISVER